VQRLARRHEQPVALRSAETDVGAHFGQTDTAEQLAIRRPYRDAAVADAAAGVAGNPEIALDVAADAVRSALHAVDPGIGEALLVRQLVVGADVERMTVALAAGPGVARPFPGAADVELLVVRREGQPVWVGQLLLGHD